MMNDIAQKVSNNWQILTENELNLNFQIISPCNHEMAVKKF